MSNIELINAKDVFDMLKICRQMALESLKFVSRPCPAIEASIECYDALIKDFKRLPTVDSRDLINGNIKTRELHTIMKQFKDKN